MIPFSTTADGRAVDVLTLSAGDLTARVLTYGAILQDVRLAGVDHGLTTGSDTLANYEGPMRYHGPIVAPVVNRLTGARAEIAGQTRRFEANQGDDITLHSGSAGTQFAVWEVRDHGPAHATLTTGMANGDGGFPGNRTIVARFEVAPPATLRLTVTVTTDAPTLVNVANHSYWNLDGAEDFAGHVLRVDADRYLPTTPDFTPTGEIADVAGSQWDFRTERQIAPRDPPLDTNFCLSQTRTAPRDVLWLRGRGGVTLTLATTEPGVQVYDGRAARRPGHAPYEALAIEAQHWPDAPANPTFPSILLHPQETGLQVTEWRFSMN